jgi:uncharacterized membrane protein
VSFWRTAYREVDGEASSTDQAEGPARTALLAGVFLSAALLLAGLLVMQMRHEARPDEPPGFRELARGLLRFDGISILYAGLIVLAATPILRVLTMIVVYLRRRERFMLVVSLVVLLLLGLGLLLGTG